MPHLGQGFGQLDRETMQLEVVAIGILVEQLGGRLRHPRTHRHQL